MLMSVKTPVYMVASIYVTIVWEVILVIAQRVTAGMDGRTEAAAKEMGQMYKNSDFILVRSLLINDSFYQLFSLVKCFDKQLKSNHSQAPASASF